VKPRFFRHPTALVESISIGDGTRVWAYVHVMKGARVGRDCNIGDHAFLESGVRVGNNVTIKNGVMLWEGVVIRDNAFIGPGAIFSNDLAPRSPRFPGAAARYATKKWLQPTQVEEGASIGASATILCGVRLGRFCMVGAGAVVTRDVPPHTLVVGSPARPTGEVCRCGARLHFTRDHARCPQCRLRFVRKRGRVSHAD
jgi:acetyltransferase-like isoleucine patch superfamily enzyme